MAVLIKTREQIARLREAGRIVAQTYEMLRPHVVPGVTTGELDRLAEEFIRKQGAFPPTRDTARCRPWWPARSPTLPRDDLRGGE